MRLYQRFRKKCLGKRINDQGFTLIEVLFAVAVLAFGLLAVSSLQGSATRGNLMAFDRTEALALAQTHMEELMALTYDELAAEPTTTVTEGNYTIERKPEPGAGPSGTLQITVTVNYSEKGIERRPVRLICLKPNI